MTGLLARLGNVIYWLFTGLAVLTGFLVVYAAIFKGENAGRLLQVVVGAIVIWGIGWVIRYILAGK